MTIIRGNKIVNISGSGSQYDGEKIPGDLDFWDTLSSDPNYVVSSTYGDLQERSVTLYHTYPFVRGAVNKQVEYAIGPGLIFRSQPDWQTLGRSKSWAEGWGKEFQKIVHFYKQRWNLYEKESVLSRGSMVYGDAFYSYIRENGDLADIIEVAGDQIDWQYNDDKYTLGIKHDALLRREGVRLTTGEDVSFINSAGGQNIALLSMKELPRQLRGYPLAYSIINHAKQDDRHNDATVQRAVMEATIFANFEGNARDLAKEAENLTKKARENATGGTVSALTKVWGSRNVNPGSVITAGGFNFTDLKTPSNTYGTFKEWILNYAGAATGTPPEVILSKYSTSYTAHRGALNDFEKAFMMKRKTMERQVSAPTNREILKDAIMNNFIDAPGFLSGNFMIQMAYLSGNHLGPVPGAVNPLQEINAKIKGVDNAFFLRSDMASMFGNEWDNFIQERTTEENEYVASSPEKRAALIQDQETANDNNQGGE